MAEQKSAVRFFDEKDAELMAAAVKTSFDEYVNQREDIDEEYEWCDWAYKGGTYRGTYDVERAKWVPRFNEGKANVGSLLFHRMVNTLGGMLGSILMSGRDLWRYADKPVRGNPMSEETGVMTADDLNALVRWCQKNDDYEQKIPEFCTAIFKQSNIFVQIGMRREKSYVIAAEDTPIDTGQIDENGAPIYTYERKLVRKEGIIEYPTISFPYPRNVYADKYIRDMQSQERVVVLSTTTKNSLMIEGEALDQEAVSKIDSEKMTWDGTYGSAGKDSDAENEQRDTMEQSRGLLLRWDVFARASIKNGKWFESVKEGDDANVEIRLVWGVYIGNTLEEAICVKTCVDFSPNEMIPIKAVRACSDNSDMLYHSNMGEIARPQYTADCALLDAAIDNVGVINDPPLSILMGMHSVKDFTFKAGQRWQVKQHDAIKQHDVRDATQQTVSLREQVRDDIKLAFATDDARLGQYAGARTSATEIMRVTGATDQTIALRNSYIIGQLLPWLGKAYITYCRDFMSPESIQRICDEQIPNRIVGTIIGEYDVVVDIVGQYEDDQQREAGLDRMMQIVGSNPAFLQSTTHRVEIGELIKLYMEYKHMPTARLILPPNTKDSEANARQRINTMLMTGVYQPPQEGENTEVHLRIARAERMRWRGFENDSDPRAPNIPLIDQYIQDLTSMTQQAAQAPSAGLPAEQTPGQEEGNQMAADLGAQMGGVA